MLSYHNNSENNAGVLLAKTLILSAIAYDSTSYTNLYVIEFGLQYR